MTTILAKARELGIRDALEKFGAFSPGVVRPKPLITAGSINDEYKRLLLQHGQNPAHRSGMEYAAAQKRLNLPTPAAPVPAAPAMTPEQAMLEKLRAGMSGGASAARANAMDRNPALVGRAAQLKVSAAKLLPPSQQPRSNNIPMVWAENESLGNPSLGNPGMSNIFGSGSLQGAIARWKSDHMGGIGKWAALAPFRPASIPAPTPKAPVTAGTPAAEVAASPLKTQVGAPGIAPVSPVPAPNMGVAQGVLGAHAQDALAKHLKLGEFSLWGVGRSAAKPPAVKKPGQISQDNGHRRIGTNFDLPRNGTSAAVSSAWNSHNVQRNSDFLNEMNEGTVGFPGV